MSDKLYNSHLPIYVLQLGKKYKYFENSHILNMFIKYALSFSECSHQFFQSFSNKQENGNNVMTDYENECMHIQVNQTTAYYT